MTVFLFLDLCRGLISPKMFGVKLFTWYELSGEHTAHHHHHHHQQHQQQHLQASIRLEPDYTCNNSLRIQSISGGRQGGGASAGHRFSLNEMTNNWSFINNSRWKLDDLLPLLHKVGWSVERRGWRDGNEEDSRKKKPHTTGLNLSD